MSIDKGRRPKPNQDVTERYKKFLNQHVIRKMGKNDCDQIINQREISKTNSAECKDVNTLLIADKQMVKDVCGKKGKGKPYEKDQNLIQSENKFGMVVCKLSSQGKRMPKCKYRGHTGSKHIVLRCENGYPVHFDRSLSANSTTFACSISNTLGNNQTIHC